MSMDNTKKNWVGPSNSEQFLMKKQGMAPLISPAVVKSVSSFRRDLLQQEVEHGLYRDGATNVNAPDVLTSNGTVTASVGKVKIAQVVSSASGYAGSGDTVQQMPEVYSPLWMNSNLSLPRDRATINMWLRSFYALNPFVHNAINLHSTYPISKLNIKCPNKEVEDFFNNMIEEIDLMNVCVQIAQEFWLLGEAFVYAEFDNTKGKWSRLQIQNPDYMIVKRTVDTSAPVIMLRPDENLKRIVTSNKPSDMEQRRQLNGMIIDAVKRGQNIPLNNFNISHLARRISPYEIRGTGLPVCIFRQLMLYDRLRESKFAQADNMVNPMLLVKVGTDGTTGLQPTFADLEAYRTVFEQAQANKDFKIFTHPGVTVENISRAAGIYDTSNDITQLMKEIFIGLQVPPVLMDGSDVTYANGGVALDALRQRYMQFRNMLASWLKRKIFAPISEIQGFYDLSGGKKQLIVPEVDWNHMALFDTADYINNLVTLTQGTDDNKRASLHSLYKSMGLEYEDEMRKIRKEAIQSAIAMKEKAALAAMDLNSLRALGDDEEIPEPAEGTAAATPPGAPGAEPLSGGMPDLGPALPGVPPPPPMEAPSPAVAPPAI